MDVIRSTRLRNLRGSGSWYSIKNSVADGPTIVSIYDEIGYVGVSAQNFISDMGDVKGPVELHLSTPGGEVFDGIAIYNYLKQRGDVHVIIDSLAASIGSVIAMGAAPGKLEMAKNSQVMIHDGFAMTVGNAQDMRKMADILDKTSDNIASIYADRTGKAASHWRDLMRNETWFSSDEAVAEGLADFVEGADSSRNSWDLSIYDNAGRDEVKPAKKNKKPKKIHNEKYDTDARKRMAEQGHAMPDGSYPIDDAEDLDNAIHAVGRGGADHDAIRKHIIKRASDLGLSERIPGNWNSDGSLSEPGNSMAQFINALRNS